MEPGDSFSAVRFDRLEQMSTGDLGRLYKSRGFAYADDMEPESLREQLKELLGADSQGGVWEGSSRIFKIDAC